MIRMIKSRRMQWTRYAAQMREKRNVYRFLVGKPEGRLTCRWEDNIEMDLREIGWGGVRLDSSGSG
jgi:hypothetical protein